MFYLTLIAGFIILRIFFYKKKEEDIDEIIDHDYSSNSESEAETDAEYENKLICDATDNMRRAANEPSDDITRDFYDESEKRPEEWTSLSDAEKREVLDKDLDTYMKEGRKKLLDTVRD